LAAVRRHAALPADRRRAGGLASIPAIGPLFSIANFICSGPLMGGVFYLFICVNRGEPAEVGEIFPVSGARSASCSSRAGAGLLVGCAWFRSS